MDSKPFKIDKNLIMKLIGQNPTRKITDSTLSKYFKKTRVTILNKTHKSGFNNYESSNNHSPEPAFKDSIHVQKMKLLSHRDKIYLTPSKRELSCLTDRLTAIKTPNSSSNSIKVGNTTFTSKSKTSTFRQNPAEIKLKYLNIPKISRNMQKISFREALKDIEWSLKAKPEIEKLWRGIINKSNGLEIVSNAGNYKVYIGKGNNAGLVKKCFATRPWWNRVESINEADFVWTQWKIEEFVKKLPAGRGIKSGKKITLAGTSFCPVHLKGEDHLLKMVTIDELGFQGIRNSPSYTFVESESKGFSGRLYNRLEHNEIITDKKGLFYQLSDYYKSVGLDPFDFIPVTFHILGENDPNFTNFHNYFNTLESEKHLNRTQNLWIIKPAEKSNRGQGISICNSISQIKSILHQQKDHPRSFIFQKYLEKPFLIHRRKFDFRCFALITSVNSILQGYFYTEGYIRTASLEFSTKDINDSFRHLTNDAIQKHGEDYGKYEDGNKMSYREFQRYIDNHVHDKKINFFQEVLPKIKELVKDSIKCSFTKIDPNRRLNCFEILGYDFMIDSQFKPWLIEVNTNPCLELSSSLLGVLIPAMVENSIKIAVDPLFPPNPGRTLDSNTENKFELIFHEKTDGEFIRSQ